VSRGQVGTVQMDGRWLALIRIGFGVVCLAAIVYQAISLIGQGVFNPTRFFLFFTILANTLAAGVFLKGGRRQLSGQPPVSDWWRGALVVFMTVTFVVFAALMSDLQEQLQPNIVWVGTVLHRVMPVGVMGDWHIEPPMALGARRRAIDGGNPGAVHRRHLGCRRGLLICSTAR
jgi:hypothetical protein